MSSIGHAFLLVYINLLLVEEAKAILGWEGIRDLLRIEEHKRSEGENEDKTVLSVLSLKDLSTLKVWMITEYTINILANYVYF